MVLGDPATAVAGTGGAESTALDCIRVMTLAAGAAGWNSTTLVTGSPCTAEGGEDGTLVGGGAADVSGGGGGTEDSTGATGAGGAVVTRDLVTGAAEVNAIDRELGTATGEGGMITVELAENRELTKRLAGEGKWLTTLGLVL